MTNTSNTTTANSTLIDFNDQSAGTIIDGQYTADGVTISSIKSSGSIDGHNPPMIFDSAHPTGGDHDLATSNLGKVLILSEDRDSNDPDDNASGGIFKFDFDGEVSVNSLTLLDVEEWATIKVYDEHGKLLKKMNVKTADNGQTVANINVDGASYMTVELCGSGAVDNLSFTKAPTLDGVVNGTSEGELIDLAYVDAQGDRIDNNDALGVEGTTGDEDLVLAGAGNDTVYAGVGDDIVRGEAGNDVLLGEGGNDILDGGDGNDQIDGGSGADTIFGGAGNDSIYGGDGNDLIDGGTGNDRIEGRNGDDVIDGGAGDDLITGYDAVSINNGDTSVLEDDGSDDRLTGGSGNDTILGGDGNDTIRGDDAFGNCPDEASDYFHEWAQDISNVVFYFDTNGDGLSDVQVKIDDFPNGGSNQFISNDLDDYYGQLAAFAADGGSVPSSATVLGVSIKGGTQPTQYFAVDGNDNGEAPDAGPTNNTGPGNDAELSYGNFFSTYDPSAQTGGDTTFDDQLEGGNGDDLIFGDKGNDTIDGGAGADTLFGDDDRDIFVNVTSGDVIDGGEGGDDFDTLDLTGANAAVRIDDPAFPENGTVLFLDSDGNLTGETASFINIENVIGAVDMGDGIVSGTADNDLIDVDYTGDPDGDFVDNNDAINGIGAPGSDDDSIEAGAGDDTILAGEGNDTVEAGDGNDSVDAGNGADLVNGGQGNDTILGGNGQDTLNGGDGDDSIIGGDDDDLIDGGEGDDFLSGRGGNDTIYGGAGNDEIVGSGNDDLLFGGDGDDTIRGASGDDTIDGGAGNDVINGANADDLIFGGDGNDTLTGAGGNDTLDGGEGNDVLKGADGDDSILGGGGNDAITGGNGNDTIDGGAGDDLVAGGRGNDLISGGDGDDTLRGNGGDDTIDGGAGNDSVSGSANDDLLSGGAGDDTVTGSGGNDTLFGNDGNDTLRGGRGNDELDGGDGDDLLTGDGNGDTVPGQDIITGGGGNDTIFGGAGADEIFGGDDRDLILGATTGDVIDGGSGGDDFDTLDLTGSDVAFITYTSDDREDGIITFRDDSTASFTDIEAVVPCFTPGTLIATPKGEIAVEALTVGDRVITRDNGIQAIRWVGKREMTAADLKDSASLCPVMIRQGSLGHGLPERDMIVSAQHRVLISNDETMLYFDEREVLVAAKHLVGRAGVERMGATDVTYIHVMFDNHEVILSDGAWTESFQPGDNSLKGLGKAQREEIYAIFPDLREKEGRDDYAAARRMLKRKEAELLLR